MVFCAALGHAALGQGQGQGQELELELELELEVLELREDKMKG